MHSSLLFIYIVPAIIFAQESNIAQVYSPTTGHICCGNGTTDPTGFCKTKNLNSFCCSRVHNYVGQGCDNLETFPVGRSVSAFPPTDNQCGVGFIGCA
ncbi:hypothetical protein LZ31DRAFT_331639 [Colletotrichum somersetense]|nr:hypothetical protein LZ31DRAFT_331639 [Colletotrichum somersetense]